MTPARYQRELDKARDKEKFLSDEKFDEFSIACSNGETTGCTSLGEWYSIVKGENDTAAEIFKTNCETRDSANSCFHLGLLHAAKRVKDATQTSAVSFLTRSCDLGNKEGCDISARAYLHGQGVEADPKKAISMLARACDLQSYKSCAFLGDLHLLGRHGVPREPPTAAKYLSIACDRNQTRACRNLSVMYQKGDGVPADIARAKLYQQRTIELLESETGRKFPG